MHKPLPPVTSGQMLRRGRQTSGVGYLLALRPYTINGRLRRFSRRRRWRELVRPRVRNFAPVKYGDAAGAGGRAPPSARGRRVLGVITESSLPVCRVRAGGRVHPESPGPAATKPRQQSPPTGRLSRTPRASPACTRDSTLRRGRVRTRGSRECSVPPTVRASFGIGGSLRGRTHTRPSPKGVSRLERFGVNFR